MDEKRDAELRLTAEEIDRINRMDRIEGRKSIKLICPASCS
jgi:hypothetical protein